MQMAQAGAGKLRGVATGVPLGKRYVLEDWSYLVTTEGGGDGTTAGTSDGGDVLVAAGTPPPPAAAPCIGPVGGDVVLQLPTAGEPSRDDDPPLPSGGAPPPAAAPERLAVPLGSAMRESLSALARAAELIDAGCREPKLWRPHGASVESKHAWRAVTAAAPDAASDPNAPDGLPY